MERLWLFLKKIKQSNAFQKDPAKQPTYTFLLSGFLTCQTGDNLQYQALHEICVYMQRGLFTYTFASSSTAGYIHHCCN